MRSIFLYSGGVAFFKAPNLEDFWAGWGQCAQEVDKGGASTLHTFSGTSVIVSLPKMSTTFTATV
jgi:hypothetical protein